MSIEKARKVKAENTLLRLITYNGNVMSRKEWLNELFKGGYRAKEGTKNKIKFSRTKFNRMDGLQQELYEKKCNEMVTCFNAEKPNGYSYEINNTEYSYLKSLEYE